MLTDVQIRKAKAADRPYKLTDGGGLHVYVTPAGGKLWRLRYELERKEKLLSIGPYPSVGLAEAREVATNAKRLLREGNLLQPRLPALPVRPTSETGYNIARLVRATNLPPVVTRVICQEFRAARMAESCAVLR
jgi:hypothetical protein